MSVTKRFPEIVAIATAISSAVCATIVVANPDHASPVAALVVGNAFLAFAILLFGALRLSAYAASLHPLRATSEEAEGLSTREFRVLLASAPYAYRLIGAAGVVLLAFTTAVFGAVSWSTKLPVEPAMALGMSIYSAALSAIALPLWGALARRP